jgi:pimeloyl-ACP methyl ester carboxylesterase
MIVERPELPHYPPMTDVQYTDYDGHRLAYRIAGDGPAIVVLHLYRRREPLIHLRLLRDAYSVFEIAPLGYGRSDRVPGYANEALAAQVLSVLDHHDIDRFVVCGYSKGGAMALSVARQTPRAAGVVCGGYAPIGFLTDALMRRLDRRLAHDHPSRTLWPYVKSIDWETELASPRCSALFYWGSEDRQMARHLRRTREQFESKYINFMEFEGLDHGAFNEDVTANIVIPAVRTWLRK